MNRRRGSGGKKAAAIFAETNRQTIYVIEKRALRKIKEELERRKFMTDNKQARTEAKRKYFGEFFDPTAEQTDPNRVRAYGHWSKGFDAGYEAALQPLVVDDETGLKPLDVVLFCPNCYEPHIDEAKLDNCESCGQSEARHGISSFACDQFSAWLNPPHKSHRCHDCNTVWRPADFPTNGVAETKTKGKNDTTIEAWNRRTLDGGWVGIKSEDDYPAIGQRVLTASDRVDRDNLLYGTTVWSEEDARYAGKTWNSIIAWMPIPQIKEQE